MKKLLLLFAFFPLSLYPQLTKGIYSIVKHSSIVDGQTMFEGDKLLDISFFMVDNDESYISFVSSSYIIAIYDITEKMNTEKSVLYLCKERKTGNNFKIMFSPHHEIKDAGELMIAQSSSWFDFFTILKEDK